MKKPINIIIADDHQLFTEGLKKIFEKYNIIHILDIVSDGKELLHILPHHQDYIILLDINMPNLNGLDTAMKLRQQYPNSKVIILSTYNEGHIIQKARSYGCKGYIVKTIDIKELINAIMIVHEGGEYFYNLGIKQAAEPSDDGIIAKYKLTKRELEILELLKKEMTNKEISDNLFLSIYTVETHRKNIMQKLNLKSPGALLKFFYNN
ncbi:MAG: response regulator transcription factor [Bacteroidetes bacterium]|jgi:two-component system nitrate/nitrite response regulator NarL|nr:response regulator transcription factor [Bacteroidota bacterium]MBK7040809.1 response regulator transcription factor [Bacteroidota bacterium]MBK9300570.1 response regulator transcription factor [Bacteroidota bacterium]